MFDFTRSVVTAQIILLAVQAALYFGIQPFEGPAHDMSTGIDGKIPFIPWTIFIYILWFPLIIFFPMMVHHFSQALYLRHMIALAIDIILSCVIYLVYPTSFMRPRPEKTALGWIMRFVYTVDFKGKNCMPSMHCSMCFLMIFTSLTLIGVIPAAAVCIIVVCLLIAAATVLTKQHVVIDVAAGFGMAVLCWGLSSGIMQLL